MNTSTEVLYTTRPRYREPGKPTASGRFAVSVVARKKIYLSRMVVPRQEICAKDNSPNACMWVSGYVSRLSVVLIKRLEDDTLAIRPPCSTVVNLVPEKRYLRPGHDHGPANLTYWFVSVPYSFYESKNSYTGYVHRTSPCRLVLDVVPPHALQGFC